jgi:hypothetical protein
VSGARNSAWGRARSSGSPPLAAGPPRRREQHDCCGLALVGSSVPPFAFRRPGNEPRRRPRAAQGFLVPEWLSFGTGGFRLSRCALPRIDPREALASFRDFGRVLENLGLVQVRPFDLAPELVLSRQVSDRLVLPIFRFGCDFDPFNQGVHTNRYCKARFSERLFFPAFCGSAP